MEHHEHGVITIGTLSDEAVTAAFNEAADGGRRLAHTLASAAVFEREAEERTAAGYPSSPPEDR